MKKTYIFYIYTHTLGWASTKETSNAVITQLLILETLSVGRLRYLRWGLPVQKALPKCQVPLQVSVREPKGTALPQIPQPS